MWKNNLLCLCVKERDRDKEIETDREIEREREIKSDERQDTFVPK